MGSILEKRKLKKLAGFSLISQTSGSFILLFRNRSIEERAEKMIFFACFAFEGCTTMAARFFFAFVQYQITNYWVINSIKYNDRIRRPWQIGLSKVQESCSPGMQHCMQEQQQCIRNTLDAIGGTNINRYCLVDAVFGVCAYY